MKLCGQISVELSVDDYIAAADHQRRLEDILRLVRDQYPEATLAMRERRERKPLSLTRAPRAMGSGALARYMEE
ncbi:hypothetical protein [Phenylobacterium sp. J367]|uniref:hypothetical protein n=1 Tax=Phenylobacterium sp. J367 TaxID=2898435 RepID=UPI002150B24F|nr:hypothetical protein [Phenylobacterium sp. J367]MCR5878380.1 hypothetical protein [Phenylobacterium sp. J367]